jgi:hypothetical protein
VLVLDLHNAIGVAANGLRGAFEDFSHDPDHEREGTVGQHLEQRHRGDEQGERRFDDSETHICRHGF